MLLYVIRSCARIALAWDSSPKRFQVGSSCP
jgi:hypothetical protein